MEMTLNNIDILPSENVDDNEISVSKSKIINNDRDNSKTTSVTKTSCISCMSHTTRSILCFAGFTSIAMLIGILIVYYSTPKPANKICGYILKSETRSSTDDDSRPHSISIGDFNKDGHPDIVVSNSGSNNIGIFLRQGNNTFDDQKTYSTGSDSFPYAVAVGDFNNDQRQDIAVANFGTNSVGIFLGMDNGTFASQRTFSTGSSRPRWIDVGDFNKDTQLDIVVVNYGTNSIGILLGTGDGNFVSQTTFSTGFDSIPYALAVTDFDHDDNLDIAVANYGTNTIGIYFGRGNMEFSIQIIFNTGINSHPYSIAINDLNNDTHMDIVVACSGSNNIGILLGFGNGTFTTLTKYSTGNNSFPQSIVIADFDNDNNLDIIVANYGTDSLGAFFGYGNGLFADQILFFTDFDYTPFSIATCDFNNDDLSDIAVVNFDHNYIDIILTYRIYSFSNQTAYSTGTNAGPYTVIVSDYNNDSRTDIFVTNFVTSKVRIFKGFGNGTFSTQASYSTRTGLGLNSVATGDFNNDNQLDMVVSNMLDNNIGIFLGYGNGSFSSQITYSTGSGSQPAGVIVADLNNDNQLDIIITNSGTNNIGIFLAFGNGSFSTQTTYSTGINSAPQSAITGHFNNDSYLDIAVANFHFSGIGVFFGRGNGTFTDQTFFFTGSGSGPNSIVTGDLNNDGQLDIIVSLYFNLAIDIFLSFGNGTFASPVSYSTGSGSQPQSINIGDFNNDYKLDIVVANCQTANVAVFKGNGDGTMQDEETYSTGSNSCPHSVAVGNFNSDNRLDIVVSNFYTSVIGIFLGFTYMTGIRENTYSTGTSPHPRTVALGDFNNDNQLDMTIAYYELNAIGVSLGQTFGNFPLNTIFSTGDLSYPTSVALDDLNNDNQVDIAVTNSGTNNVAILFGDGNGNFSSPEIYSTGFGSIPQSLAINDFNNDRKPDIVVVNSGTNNIFTFLKYDIGAFKKQISHFTGTHSTPQSVSAGDFNNDGWIDFVVANSGINTIGIFLGLGNGTFSSQVASYSTGIGSSPQPTIVVDLNNDSYLDIVVANYYSGNIGVFLGYGHGNFSNQTTYATGSNSGPADVTFADLNKDNCLDIIVALELSHNIGIFYGNGDGTFSNVSLYPTGTNSYPISVAIADFNEDNRLDIVVVNYATANMCIFYGSINDTFSIQGNYSTGSGSHPDSVIVADFNNDHRLDIAVANSGTDNIGIFFGNSNHTFSQQITLSTGNNSAPSWIAAGDFNNDNQMDIVTANYGNGYLGVLLGCVNGTFFSQLLYSTGDNSEPYHLAIADFNNDSRLDVIIANYGSDSVGVLFGYVNESFLNAPAYSTGLSSQPTSIAIADFDNDTQKDIVVTNTGMDNIMIIFGSGYGTFNSQTITYSTGNGSQPCWVAVGDFNMDNRSDIVVANSGSDNIGVFLSNGTNSFSKQMNYFTGVLSRPYSVAILDFNNDTLLDIAVANYGANNLVIFLGFGNGSFAMEQIFPTGFKSNPFALAVGDVNNDRLMDIVATNNGYGNFNQICTEILPRICHNVKYFIVELNSMERILLAANYPNLTQLKIVNFKQDIALHYFTDESSLRNIFQQQITQLILINNDTRDIIGSSENYTKNVYGQIFNLFKNLKHFSVDGIGYRSYPSLTL
ncbi:unnamed protein product, partial [Adineta steineri]